MATSLRNAKRDKTGTIGTQTKGRPKRRRLRFGLGDAFVVSAFVALAWLAGSPHYRGQRIRHREQGAMLHIMELARATARHGLRQALAKLLEKSLSIHGLDAEQGTGSAQPIRSAIWRDRYYRYYLDLLADEDLERSFISAIPIRPGPPRLRIDAKDEVQEESRGEATSGYQEEVSSARNRARSRLLALHEAIKTSGLQKCMRDFSKEARASLKPSLGVQCLGSDRSYLYTIRALYRSASAQLEPELYAWPLAKNHTGYSVYRYTLRDGFQQSRNKVASYEGSQFPPVGAGMLRSGSDFDSMRGYAGLDKNHWLPCFGDADRLAMANFTVFWNCIRNTAFAKSYRRFATKWKGLAEPQGFISRFDFQALRAERNSYPLLTLSPRVPFQDARARFELRLGTGVKRVALPTKDVEKPGDQRPKDGAKRPEDEGGNPQVTEREREQQRALSAKMQANEEAASRYLDEVAALAQSLKLSESLPSLFKELPGNFQALQDSPALVWQIAGRCYLLQAAIFEPGDDSIPIRTFLEYYSWPLTEKTLSTSVFWASSAAGSMRSAMSQDPAYESEDTIPSPGAAAPREITGDVPPLRYVGQDGNPWSLLPIPLEEVAESVLQGGR